MYDHKEIDKTITEFWNNNQIYKKAKLKVKGKKKFLFIDGPPFVTGEIHPGTAWNKCIKDSILRFYRMRGYDVNDQPGFDTHGLPIEVKVEKKLNISNKKQIEEFGLDKFIEECRNFAETYRQIMTDQLKKFHVWMDWDNPYITFKKEYIVRSWKVIKKAYEKGLLKEGDYVVPYCQRCETTLANYELEYHDLEDPSIYVLFKAKDGRYLLIWTTTPWTLVANLAVMVNPEKEYLEIESNGKRIIIAEARFEDLKKFFKDAKIVNKFLGKELENLEYEHPFQDLIDFKWNRKVILSSEYVDVTDGTGLVHSAPGHGEEDYKVGKSYGLPTFSFVDDQGNYIDLAGTFKKKNAREQNQNIISILKERGLLVHAGTIKHSYPICWRCKTPLIYRTTHQWFITITDLKQNMIEQASKVKWVPEFAKKRFINFLKESPDWCISRQRYWGIPLPIWKSDDGEVIVLDTLDKEPKDYHRPYIDEIEIERNGKKFRRVPDVLDVWFDSGNAVWASTGLDEQADFIVEGQDQIRGWFYSLLGSGIVYYDMIPYKAVAMHGFFVDEKGEKMSKSLGNFVPVEIILERVGADAFRLFGLSNNIWEDLKFNWKDLEDSKKDLDTLLNMVEYLKQNYFETNNSLNIEDEWILSKLNKTYSFYISKFSEFEYYEAVRALRLFITDVSKIYLKIFKQRIKEGKAQAKVLYQTILKILLMLAPVAPAVSEYAYQRFFKNYEKQESIFLIDLKDPEPYDEKIIQDFDEVMEIVSKGLEIRQKLNINLRTPIEAVYVPEKYNKFVDIFKIMLNVNQVKYETSEYDYKDDKYYIYFEKQIDEEKGLVNEIRRRIQYYRKLKNLSKDQILVINYEASDKVRNIIEKYKKDLENETKTVLNYASNEGKLFKIKEEWIKFS
jgi:isoleucyl-tRNA synthetase